MLRGWTAWFLPPVLHEPCGPIPILGVHEIATYARFSMLKKLDFNLIPGFHGPTSWFSPGLKTVRFLPKQLMIPSKRDDLNNWWNCRSEMTQTKPRNQWSFSQSRIQTKPIFKPTNKPNQSAVWGWINAVKRKTCGGKKSD